MASESPAVIIFNTDSQEVSVKDGHTIALNDSGFISLGSSSGVAKPITLNSLGYQIVTGSGTAGSPDTGVVTVQGISSGQPINVSVGSWNLSTPIEIKHKNYASFTILSTATSPSANKSMLSLFNAGAVVLKIQEIYLVNVQSSAVSGVDINFEFRRMTGHTSGTLISAIETLDTLDSLDSNISVRTGATITGESSVLLWRNIWHSDESSPALDGASLDHAVQTMFPVFSRKNLESKAITLRNGEGITIKCTTSSTVGSFDLMAIVTQE
jgi:hypothetical protein